jgi:hypothetical protein
MTNERRYGEKEIAEIFQAAASAREADGHALTPAGGFSLGELQAIGSEVGIAPDRIADAAESLELRRGAAPRRKHLGMPVGVGRTVDLPRAPTDHEWELLVTELRATFGAHGKESSSGGLRSWRNGNLHAYVEPTETGHRLRMGTTKGNGIAAGWMGLGALMAAVVMLMILALQGDFDEDLGAAVLFIAMGFFALASNAMRLPRWADEREEQMEHIAARARSLIRPEPGPAAIPSAV